MIELQKQREIRTVVLGIQHPGMTARQAAELTEELAGLAATMELLVVDRQIVKLKEINPKYLIGAGKAAEIAQWTNELEADCIVFDDELSPSQQRNWEKLTGIAVIDRHEVILDIFASRAMTREAALQVALARLEYSLPRLQRAWSHLSRQRGGARGTRGEGETQLEIDRRVVVRKIERIRNELEEVRRQRSIRRKQRMREPVPSASIVGYTNVGKSSLLTLLSHSEVYAENKLFATLDPTTRRVALPGGHELVVTDTVGFIRKLPHDLIESFKSTLEETVLADYLIHVLDASSPDIDEHYETTIEVLKEIGANGKPGVTILNKIDLVTDPAERDMVLQRYPDAIPFSTRTGEGLTALAAAVGELLSRENEPQRFRLPADRYDLVALVHRKGKVLSEEYLDGTILLSAEVAAPVRHLLAEFAV